MSNWPVVWPARVAREEGETGGVLVTPPASEPLTLDEAKEYLRVETDDDDAIIAAMITQAREIIETRTRTAMLTQSWRQGFSLERIRSWPMNRPPLQTVDKVEYIDEDGTVQEIPSDEYHVDVQSWPGRITIKEQYRALYEFGPTRVFVDYTCGYTSADMIPGGIMAGMSLQLMLLYSRYCGKDCGEAAQAAIDQMILPHCRELV